MKSKTTIRFINSQYDTLFTIEDGEYICVDYGAQKILKRCFYLDDYHTQIGGRVFHICEYAEVMERNGYTYTPEAAITTDCVAWLIGGYKRKLLMIQTSDDGYEYSLYEREDARANFHLVDGGFVDDPDATFQQIRSDVLSTTKYADWDLEVEDYYEMLDLVED